MHFRDNNHLYKREKLKTSITVASILKELEISYAEYNNCVHNHNKRGTHQYPKDIQGTVRIPKLKQSYLVEIFRKRKRDWIYSPA